MLFSDETVSIFYVFGFEYDHGFLSDQGYIWFLLFLLIPLIYLTLFYLNTGERIKHMVLIVSFMLTNNFLKGIIAGFNFISIEIWGFVSVSMTILFYLTLFSLKILVWPSFYRFKHQSIMKLNFLLELSLLLSLL